MVINKDQFPVVVQAFEISDNKEFFVAEQVVASQAEADAFAIRYTGKVIKARAVTTTESSTIKTRKQGGSKAVTYTIVIILILALLIAVGYYTGWIQRTLS